jgi:hypothetical protein
MTLGEGADRLDMVGIDFPVVPAASICLSKLTICYDVCILPCSIPGSSHISLSHTRGYKSNRALRSTATRI